MRLWQIDPSGAGGRRPFGGARIRAGAPPHKWRRPARRPPEVGEGFRAGSGFLTPGPLPGISKSPIKRAVPGERVQKLPELWG
jgi:hypothetical protein